MEQLNLELSKKQELLKQQDLINRKDILRKMEFTTSKDTILTKGLVACEIGWLLANFIEIKVKFV